MNANLQAILKHILVEKNTEGRTGLRRKAQKCELIEVCPWTVHMLACICMYVCMYACRHACMYAHGG
jgi:hypothetical protein